MTYRNSSRNRWFYGNFKWFKFIERWMKKVATQIWIKTRKEKSEKQEKKNLIE